LREVASQRTVSRRATPLVAFAPAMTRKDDETSTALRKELDAALAEVSAAEQALDIALREIRAGVRSEKVTISTAIEGALTRLRNGRAALAKVQQLVDKP
jgi:hypothetical protein